jgi:hypothetical protein
MGNIYDRTFDKDNFYNRTMAIFEPCAKPELTPDYVSFSRITGARSSEYWYGQDDNGFYVIRESDHWSERGDCLFITNCWWTLEQGSCGKCYFKNFKFINDKQHTTLWQQHQKKVSVS